MLDHLGKKKSLLQRDKHIMKKLEKPSGLSQEIYHHVIGNKVHINHFIVKS